MKTLSSLALLLAVLGQAGPAQEQEKEAPIKVDVDVVNVLCTVYDQHGALIKDLKKEDFRIREEGKPQKIGYFARETNLPLTVALLVDVSGSVRRFLEVEKETAAQFLKAVIRPEDQALLMGFSSTVILWQDFTSSAEVLRAKLEKLRSIPFRGLPAEGQPMPGTLLYDAVHGAAMDRLKDVTGRKVMVIISDGLDNGSRVHLPDAVKGVQMTNTIVYGICYENGFSGCSFLKNISQPTGGHVFQVGKKTSLTEIFERIQDEMRGQYALGYVSTNRAHDGRFRKLQVKVLPKGLRAEARKGYYAVQE
jgi:VWFA-related protein